MITISYTVDGIRKEAHFAKDKKGNQQSVKFIESLYEERKRHPWFYKLKKIKTLKDKLADKKLGSRSKKKVSVRIGATEGRSRQKQYPLCM